MEISSHAHNQKDVHYAWPKDSAARKMTVHVPTAHSKETIDQVKERITKDIQSLESINYVYVLDDQQKLIGVLSMKDLYRFPGDVHVGNACKKGPLVTVKPTTHQERVAYLALSHNIKSIPVIDDEHVFLGAIPSDVILSILYKEAHEDILHLAGVHHHKAVFSNVLTSSLWESLLHRIPWLFIGLLGGLAAARIIGLFEQTLENNLIVASFIPLIVYMSDAVGTQMEAYFIRDIAMDRHLPFLRYFLRHFIIIALIGIIFSAMLLGASALLFESLRVSIVISISLFVAILASVFTGLLVPYFFNRLKLDPANASGPIATIIQDILSIVIYFLVVSALL